jgi:endoglycosylceramidase
MSGRVSKMSLLCAFFVVFSASVSASEVLRADAGGFRDSQGRAIFLRGVNVSADSKYAPFLPLQARDRVGTIDPALLDPLPRWGFNTIRLLFNWEAYEPAPGHYNETYLNQLTELADQAWARGLYVIVDLHQDSYSRYLAGGCGEGFPAWAVPARDRHLFTTPPHACGQMWAMSAVFSSGMHDSFRAFYADSEGARTAFLTLWERLAHHFSAHPGVIGYDVLNEPWGEETRELAPLYRDAARVIRAQDPSSILFIEPQVFLTTFGFRKSQLPQPDFANFVFAPHYYDPVAAALNAWSYWRAGITKHAFGELIAKASQLGAPLFIGEFGQSGTMGNARAFSDYQYDELDSHFLSATQWNYTPSWSAERRDGWNHEDMSIVDGDGKLRTGFYPRPFAQAVAGAPVSQLELRDRLGEFASYELRWKQSASPGAADALQNETTLYFPREILAAPELLEWSLSGADLSCETDLALSRVRCRGAPGAELKLRVSRRTPLSRAGS